MKNYVVTGALGFIGSALCRHLLDAGHTVMGIDLADPSNGRAQSRYRALRTSDGFRFRRVDLRESSGVVDALADNDQIDALFNLAGLPGVRSVRPGTEYWQCNCETVVRLLGLSTEFGIRKFVQASTSSVYGDTETVPFTEGETGRPLSQYAASKAAAELACRQWAMHEQIDVTVLRFFTVYGPDGRDDMLIYRCAEALINGASIPINGDGEHIRDFTYVADIVRGILKALRLSGYHEINLGSGRPLSITGVIRMLSRITGIDAVVEYGPAHPADVMHTHASVRLAKDLLEWEPLITIEDGLAETVAWHSLRSTQCSVS